MKKILSVALAAAMLGAMAIPAVSALPTDQTTAATIDTTKSNTITIQKYDPDMINVANDGTIIAKTVDAANGETPEQALAKAGVDGATFTAFKVLAYDGTSKTYSFTRDFADKGINLDNVIKASADTYTTYGTTSELEKEINIMQKVAGTLSGDASATTENGGRAVIDLGANPGVYLVMETVVPDNYIVTTQAFLVSAPTFDGSTDEWVYNVDALPKNQKIDIDKSVDDAVADTGTNDSSDAYAVGDIVDYTVTVAVPNYGRSTTYPDYKVTDAMAIYDNDPTGFGVTRFNNLDVVFTDTLSNGLTFLPDSVKVEVSTLADPLTLGTTKKTITNAEHSETATAVKAVTYSNVSGDGDYTLTQDGQTFTVDVSWLALNDLQGQTITLTYKAQVNANAVAGTAQNNTATVKFTNDPTSKKGEASDPTKPPTDTDTDDDNDIYTYAMDTTKLFDNAAGTAAENADVVFTLSKGAAPVVFTYDATTKTYTVWTGRKLESNGKVYAVPATYGVDPADADFTADGQIPADVLVPANELTANVSPLADGVLKINGLDDGTYTLTETKTADGYTILTAPLEIVITEEKGDGNKVLPSVTATVDGTAVDSDYDVTTEVSGNTTTTTYTGHFKFTVNNPKAKFFSLPTTGGLGLWLFTVGGGVLMAGAIIFITVLRKKKNS